MYGPTAATRPRVLGAGWGEGGPLALFSWKASFQRLFIYIEKLISEAEKDILKSNFYILFHTNLSLFLEEKTSNLNKKSLMELLSMWS